MDLKRVEEIIELMRESGVTQLSLELPDFKVSITRGPHGPEVSGLEQQAVPADDPATAPGEGRPELAGEQRRLKPVRQAQGRPAAPGEASALSVVSPVVGVFHNGGMLDPREMIRAGDRVREGQLLAAIEAMKVPNELRAPVSGFVTELLVEDGSAVEYGQALFVIDPEDRGEGSDAEPPIGLA